MEKIVPWMDNDDLEDDDFYDEEENDFEEYLNKRNRKIREDYHTQVDKPHKLAHKKQRKKKNDDSQWLML